MSERCKAMVATSLGRYSGYPCQKRAKANGYCGNHDPEALERRIKNAHAGRVKERAEYLTALKLAAYRAGVEAAAKACEAEADNARARLAQSKIEQETMSCHERVDSYEYDNRVSACITTHECDAANIRALPDPTPEQMEKIK